MSILENRTKEKIINVAFKLFLENGYEATNIRDICKEVGIKASTLYFYYKSKQELFFSIYDDTIQNYIDFIHSIEELKQNIPLEEKLYLLLKLKMDYFASDISKRKFILRYHLFPPEEISNIIRDKYIFFINEENKIILDVMANSQDKDALSSQGINGCLLEYKRLESYLAYEMILSNIKLNDKEIRRFWTAFWNKAVS